MTFLFKGTDVTYIDLSKGGHRDCVGQVLIDAPSFCMGLHDVNYSDIKTVLTEDQWNRLIAKNESLAYKDNAVDTDIVETLLSEENEKLFLEIQEEEKHKLMDLFEIPETEAAGILNDAPNGYHDSGVVGGIYPDYESLGREYISSISDVPDYLDGYIDYEGLGEETASDGYAYYILSDGRIVEYYR